MKLLDKFIAKVKALNPNSSLTEDSSELEVLNELDELTPLAETRGQLDDILSRLGVLEETATGGDSMAEFQESIESRVSALEAVEVIDAVEATADAREALKKDILKSVSAKLVQTPKGPKNDPPLPSPKIEEHEEEDNVKVVTMDQLFTQAQVVPGLL